MKQTTWLDKLKMLKAVSDIEGRLSDILISNGLLWVNFLVGLIKP